MLDFNETIEYPEEMTREGFTFTGWSPRPERMPAENIIVNIQWEITNPTEYVEIVFSDKGLGEEEVREIIKEIVTEGTEFEIVKFESEPDETTVIIKFSDKETAEEFIKDVSASSGKSGDLISVVGFVPYRFIGFSSTLCNSLTLLGLVLALI